MKHLSSHLVAPLVSLALLGPAAAWAQSSHGAGHGASAAGASHGSQQMHQAMMSGMESMRQMKPSGDTDKDFVMMMKMHHQQAVEMAQAEVPARVKLLVASVTQQSAECLLGSQPL